jgi:hypothetical protein
MNKQEAGSFLKELLIKCEMDSDSFILVEPNPKDTLSNGYKVRVKTILNNECRKQIREITKKYDLAVIEEEFQIIIYKPKSKNSGNLILK